MVKKIHKMVLGHRRLKVRMLSDIIIAVRVHHITENLDIIKLCAKWVPPLLTIEQKQRRLKGFDFAMFHSNKAEFLHRYIMDETYGPSLHN